MARSEWAITQDMMNGKFTTDAPYAAYYVDAVGDRAIQVLATTAKTIKFWFCNDETQMEYVKTVSLAEFDAFLTRFGFKPATQSKVRAFKYPGWKSRVKELGKR